MKLELYKPKFTEADLATMKNNVEAVYSIGKPLINSTPCKFKAGDRVRVKIVEPYYDFTGCNSMIATVLGINSCTTRPSITGCTTSCFLDTVSSNGSNELYSDILELVEDPVETGNEILNRIKNRKKK